MKNKLIWLEALLLLAPLIALLALWGDFPERVPIHWNVRGQIDDWSSKTFLFLLPLTSVLTIALLHVLPRFDPKLRRSPEGLGRMQSVLGILRLALAAFFAAIFWIDRKSVV